MTSRSSLTDWLATTAGRLLPVTLTCNVSTTSAERRCGLCSMSPTLCRVTAPTPTSSSTSTGWTVVSPLLASTVRRPRTANSTVGSVQTLLPAAVSVLAGPLTLANLNSNSKLLSLPIVLPHGDRPTFTDHKLTAMERSLTHCFTAKRRCCHLLREGCAARFLLACRQVPQQQCLACIACCRIPPHFSLILTELATALNLPRT